MNGGIRLVLPARHGFVFGLDIIEFLKVIVASISYSFLHLILLQHLFQSTTFID